MRFFKGMPPFGEGRTHHVHIVAEDNDTIEHRLLFRDILRCNKKIRLEYQALKVKLLESNVSDRELYTDNKAAFIKSVLFAHGYSKSISR